MARLTQVGMELHTAANAVEITVGNGTPAIDTGTVRTGTDSLKIAVLNQNATINHKIVTGVGPFFFRFYMNIAVLPTVGNSNIVEVKSASNKLLDLTTTGTLQLYNSATQIGSDSSALSTGTWYRVEIKYDNSPAGGSQVLEAKLNGTVFATASNLTITAGDIQDFDFTNFGHASTIYYDDIATNDSSGSNQASYPGAGQIVHLQPAAAGDNNAWSIQVGGTAGSSNNYTRVKEITPDDATSYNGDITSGDIDDFALTATPASIGSSDTINTVAVGARFRAVIAAGESPFVMRCKAVSGGTVSESATITPNVTVWVSNDKGGFVVYQLVLYTKPGGSNPWTKADLDTSQIGYRITTTGTNATDISTIWMSIDSTPVIVSATIGPGWKTLLGAGQA